jgi:hypothetical protein
LRQRGAAPALDYSEIDGPALIAELSNPAFLVAGDSNDAAVFAAAPTHPLTHGPDPLCLIKRRRQQLFSIRITSLPAQCHDLMSGSLTALLTALERAFDGANEFAIHAFKLVVAIRAITIGSRRLRAAVSAWRATPPRLFIGRW